MPGQKIVVILLLQNATKIWQAHLTSRDRAKDLRFQKNQTAVLKGTIAITQVTSDLVKLKNNRELTASDIRKSIIPIIKTCTEAMTFLAHANQEADSIKRSKKDKHCYVIT